MTKDQIEEISITAENWNDVILVQFKLNEDLEPEDMENISQSLKSRVCELAGRDVPIFVYSGGDLEVVTKENKKLEERVQELERIVTELADSHGLAYG